MATYGSGIRTKESGTPQQAMQTSRTVGGVWGYLDPDSVDAAIRTGVAKGEAALNTFDLLSIDVTMLPPGRSAYAQVTGSIPNLTLEFGIPRARDGISADAAQTLADAAEQAKDAALVAQVKAEDAEAAAFAEPDAVVSQMVADAATRTHTALGEEFYRRDELSGLLPWRLAYGQRASTKARIVVLGSGEGQGATTTGNRWMEVLQENLRGEADGGIWLAAASSQPSIESAGLTVSGTSEVGGGTSGWGGRLLLLRGGSEASTASMSMTSATVWFQTNNFFTNDGEVLVDGSKVADLPGVGEFAPAQQVTVTMTPGQHTLTVRSVGSADNAFELNAVQVFDGDENRGVEIIEGAHAGEWLRSITSDAWDQSHNPVIEALNPTLVVVYAGDQDWLDGVTGFFEGAVAGIPAHIDSLVARNHSLLLVLPPRPVPPAGADLDPARYAYVREMMASAAVAHPLNAAFFDAGAYFPRLEPGGETSMGLFVEPDRPQTLSDEGHRWLASVLTDLLQ